MIVLDMKKPGARDIYETTDMDVDDETTTTTDFTMHSGEFFCNTFCINCITFLRKHKSTTES